MSLRASRACASRMMPNPSDLLVLLFTRQISYPVQRFPDAVVDVVKEGFPRGLCGLSGVILAFRRRRGSVRFQLRRPRSAGSSSVFPERVWFWLTLRFFYLPCCAWSSPGLTRTLFYSIASQEMMSIPHSCRRSANGRLSPAGFGVALNEGRLSPRGFRYYHEQPNPLAH